MTNYVITIARGYGSGGRTIGKMLAKELGIAYYDRELLKLASEESGINEQLFGKHDENIGNSLLNRIMKGAYKGELIPPDSEDFISNDNLFNYQAKVINELAVSQSCVIVGRCADYILKDMDHVVKLFVHASLADCTNRLVEMYGQSAKELEKKIITTDKRRAAYYNYYTGRSWNDANNYDLCLNMGRLSFEKGVEIVKAYLDIKFKDSMDSSFK